MHSSKKLFKSKTGFAELITKWAVIIFHRNAARVCIYYFLQLHALSCIFGYCKAWCSFTWKQCCFFIQYLMTLQCALVLFGLVRKYCSSSFFITPQACSVQHNKCGLCIVFMSIAWSMCSLYLIPSFLGKLYSTYKTRCYKIIWFFFIFSSIVNTFIAGISA